MKTLHLLFTFFILLIASGPLLAGVAASKHDLTTATGTAFSTTGNTAEVCVFCHTPHGGNNNGAPLWNRTTSATSFTMYNSTFSSTIDMTVAGSPQGVSAACLSCHDGTIGFDVLINATTSASGTYNYNAAGADQAWAFTGDDSMVNQSAPVKFTSDLTNQHPISITYDNTADTAFLATPTAPVVLYNGQVECGSCHNPHDDAIVPFLRTSNAASALCNSCHIK